MVKFLQCVPRLMPQLYSGHLSSCLKHMRQLWSLFFCLTWSFRQNLFTSRTASIAWRYCFKGCACSAVFTFDCFLSTAFVFLTRPVHWFFVWQKVQEQYFIKRGVSCSECVDLRVDLMVDSSLKFVQFRCNTETVSFFLIRFYTGVYVKPEHVIK